MDDLMHIESDSDDNKTFDVTLNNKQMVRNNKLKLQMWKDVLSSLSVNEKQQVNDIIRDCNVDSSRIKCMEWSCIDKLPAHLKPSHLSKCQLNLNKINPAKHLDICKNYSQLCTRNKYCPNDPSNGPSDAPPPSHSSETSSSKSDFVFNFQPNFNIDNHTEHLPDPMTEENIAFVKHDAFVQNKANLTHLGMSNTLNNLSNNSKFTSLEPNPSKLDGRLSHSERQTISNPSNGSSKYFSKPNNATSRFVKTSLINGSSRDVRTQNGPIQGMNGNISNEINVFRQTSTENKEFNSTTRNSFAPITESPDQFNPFERFDLQPNGFSNKPTNRFNGNQPIGLNHNITNGLNGHVTNELDGHVTNRLNGHPDNGSNDERTNAPDNPFCFSNYYKKEANSGTARSIHVNKDIGHQGTNLDRGKSGSFRTARTELGIQQLKKNKGKPGGSIQFNGGGQGSDNWLANKMRRTLGTKTRSVSGEFVPPTRPHKVEMDVDEPGQQNGTSGKFQEEEEEVHEKYKGIDKVMIERIENEIMDQGKPVSWDDIAGLKFAKQTIQEVIVWPMLRPDIFTGLRKPPKGILLFGPPGTGKTLIGKCVAAQCKATFFCISASTLTSKWFGEGEKMVRALFAVASVHQPSIIFIDEIDSLLCQRSDQENETSRRLKTEFLISLDGAATEDNDRVLVIGATNRPQELDEAARRRLVKRLYIPLPDEEARCEIVTKLLANITNSLSVEDIEDVGRSTVNFSGADMASLCREASLGPVRTVDLKKIDVLDVRPISVNDFHDALKSVRPSVCQGDLNVYQDWNQKFGSGSC